MGIINIHKPFHIIGNRFKTSRYCENRFNAGFDGVEGKIEAITYARENKIPYFGICLGMQMLFEGSLESEDTEGFGIFKGNCPRFKKGKVPQIGWNQINITKESPLLKGIPNKSFFYFLHGYYVETENKEIVTAITDYFINYASMIEKDNIFGVQFHPEKSGKMGLKMLNNWLEIC